MKVQLNKVNQHLLFIVLFTAVLFYGRPILIPLFFAILLAMLMAPLCSKLDSKGVHRIFSCLICVFILFVVFFAMLWLVLAQTANFIKDLPLLEQKAGDFLINIQQYIERKLKIPVAEQTAFIKEQTKDLGQFTRTYLTSVLRSSIGLLAGLIITLVVTFLLLFQKEKYYNFFLQFAKSDSPQQREKVLSSIGQVAQHYLTGRAVSIGVLFFLYAVALLIIGVKNALALAAVAAIFNIIPYLGPFLAALFPVLVALVTEQSYQPAMWVLISFCLFQALDNYWVTPYFLGGEVSLSALSTIIAMICGGFLWGIPGMILFIPMLSIVRIIFDHLPGMEHYGKLIGDQGKRPTENIGAWLSKMFSRQ